MKLKLLWYCTKNKPYLIHMPKDKEEFEKGIEFSLSSGEEFKQACIDIKNNGLTLNGKIACVSDYEVEELFMGYGCGETFAKTKTMQLEEILKRSCLSEDELCEYMPNYAIHIKNLNIFDKSKELSEFYSHDDSYDNMFGWAFEDRPKYIPLKKAPRNMNYVYNKDGSQRYILISSHPDCMAQILNGLKTIDPRKRVLKEMFWHDCKA